MTGTQKQTLDAMQILLHTGVPVLLWGDPGTGKTQTVQRFALDAGWRTESVIASLHDPTDFGGLPVRTPDGVTFEPPAWARRVAGHDGPSLVFFDEINTAAPATQNALMRVVLEHRVGELDLGEGVRFVAAANPVSQNSGAWDLSAPLANRFAHLQWTVTVEEWRAGFLNGWPRPAPLSIDETAPAVLRAAKARVAAFVTTRPALLTQVPDTDTAASAGWPSSRTWELLARCHAVCDTVGSCDTVRMLVARALIGDGAAAEHAAYVRDLDLPDPLDLLADPDAFKQLKRTDQQFAALEAVAATVTADVRKHWRDGFKVCIAAAAGAPDIAASVAARLVEAKPPGVGLPAGFEAFAEVLADAGMLHNETKAA